jgi:hypothetical protein
MKETRGTGTLACSVRHAQEVNAGSLLENATSPPGRLNIVKEIKIFSQF